MKNKTGLVILIVCLLIAVGTIVAYRMWNKPHTTIESLESLRITATELIREFESDEAAANKKYLDNKKAIEVTGTVSDVSKNQEGFPIVVLQGAESSTEIVCSMRERNANVTAGSSITIKGSFTNYDGMFGIKITDCILVE